jgi:hypothetical protein
MALEEGIIASLPEPPGVLGPVQYVMAIMKQVARCRTLSIVPWGEGYESSYI